MQTHPTLNLTGLIFSWWHAVNLDPCTMWKLAT